MMKYMNIGGKITLYCLPQVLNLVCLITASLNEDIACLLQPTFIFLTQDKVFNGSGVQNQSTFKHLFSKCSFACSFICWVEIRCGT